MIESKTYTSSELNIIKTAKKLSPHLRNEPNDVVIDYCNKCQKIDKFLTSTEPVTKLIRSVPRGIISPTNRVLIFNFETEDKLLGWLETGKDIVDVKGLTWQEFDCLGYELWHHKKIIGQGRGNNKLSTAIICTKLNIHSATTFMLS